MKEFFERLCFWPAILVHGTFSHRLNFLNVPGITGVEQEPPNKNFLNDERADRIRTDEKPQEPNPIICNNRHQIGSTFVVPEREHLMAREIE